jgi:uncharacterized protein YndB with AHSA1/START domain
VGRPERHRDAHRPLRLPNGGSYRYLAAYEGVDYAFRGCFHEVRPAELIVQTFTFEGMPDGVALEKLIFEDLGNGRTRLTTTSLVDSFEGRDGFVASGMEVGVREGYEKHESNANRERWRGSPLRHMHVRPRPRGNGNAQDERCQDVG